MLTVTFTYSSDDKDGEGVCDSIAYLDLKSRMSFLVAIVKDGRDGRCGNKTGRSVDESPLDSSVFLLREDNGRRVTCTGRH